MEFDHFWSIWGGVKNPYDHIFWDFEMCLFAKGIFCKHVQPCLWWWMVTMESSFWCFKWDHSEPFRRSANFFWQNSPSICPKWTSKIRSFRSYICSSLQCVFLALFMHSKTGDELILFFGMCYCYEYTMKKMQKKFDFPCWLW